MRLFEELEGQEHSMILKLFMWNTFLGALLIMSHLFSLAEAMVSRSIKISFGFVFTKANGRIISGALDNSIGNSLF